MIRGAPKDSSRFANLGGAETRNASEHALALLVDSLRAGLFEVGDCLPPLRALAAELGVSHVVVRQAIEVLEVAKVLEVRPGRSGGIFFVGMSGIPRALAKIYRVPNRDEAIALLHARWLIESEIAGKVCASVPEDQFAPLGLLVERLEATNDVALFVELTVRFNLTMALLADNPVLTGFLREILNKMAIVGLRRGKAAPKFDVVAPVAGTYRGLLDALRSRDHDEVQRHVNDHMARISVIYSLGDVNPPSLLAS